MDSFSDLKTQQFVLDIGKIKSEILKQCRSDRDSSGADYRSRQYYQNNGHLLWISMKGIHSSADTLISFLEHIGDIGFTKKSFYVEQLKEDILTFRNLDFGNDSVKNVSGKPINEIAARIEYRLTKAYLRYAIGQSFGYVNPIYVLNRIDPIYADTTKTKITGYRRLYDIDILRPTDEFINRALHIIKTDSLGSFLRDCQPDSPLYLQLKKRLAEPGISAYLKQLIICNMEYSRWRERNPLDTNGKYVFVNLPAFHLYACNGEKNIVDMRIGCGAQKTKTPLLTSKIERMDVNPVWNIPVSIIKNEVAHHAGDRDYFERNNYDIINRETGESVEPDEISVSALRSGKYRVVQKGGEGNSLGRIIFRFANNFSVFLHDTSSKGVFSRTFRGVSHGCVRIQKPFEFAVFLMDEEDEWKQDKLRISMGLEPKTERGKAYIVDDEKDRNLVRSVSVKNVPLKIGYYTLYPDSTGILKEYFDIYGYDKIILSNIKQFQK
ncbi:L,D-transpeptidase family protein [Xylanibacter muris]|nr:L,D-transpeptidase family protein [Xylanibacter muris]